MNQFCQIEHVDSDSDIGAPCDNLPWLNVLTAGQRFVQIAGRGVAGNHSASNAAITMRRNPAYESRFRTSAMRR